MAKNWTRDDIPDQRGKLAIITGANTGLGLETAKALAARGAAVVLAVRNTDKGKAAMAAITAETPGAQITIEELDLSSLDSVRSTAQRLRTGSDRIDLLVNNAGVMYTPRSSTAEGFELQFGTNHLGHFAFTGLLLDRMLGVEGSRVVTVSSMGHRILSAIDFSDLHCRNSYNRVAAYGRSKLANLLFTYELQRRLANAHAATSAYAAHPGVSSTELIRNLPGPIRAAAEVVFRPMAQSAAMGALPTLRAATDQSATGGQYYGPGGMAELGGYPVAVTSSRRSHDAALQRRLWASSEELTGVTYSLNP